jgi:hypothetical protein
VFLARFQPSKLLYHPKQKPRRGGGLRKINTCRQIPLNVNFLEKHLGFGVFIVIWSMVNLLQVGSQHSRAKNQQRMV